MLVGVLLAFATSVSWAIGNYCIQRSGQQIGAPRALLWALASGGLLSGLCALLLDQRAAPVTAAVVGWLLVGAVFGVLAYVCLFYALSQARLTIAVPLVSSWAFWAALLSVAVMGESPRPSQLAGGALVFVGVLLVSVGATRSPAELTEGAPQPVARRTLLAAFGSALGFGVMVPAMGQVGPAVGAFGAAALVYFVGIALVLPIAWRLRVDLRWPPRRVWPLVLATGLVETGGFVLITLARRYAPTAVVSPVASLSSALTLVFGWLVLRERPHPVAAVGAVVASVGLVVLAV